MSEGTGGEGARGKEGVEKGVVLGEVAAGGLDGGDGVGEGFGEADVEIEIQRVGEGLAPVGSDGSCAEASHQFLEQKTEGTWVIAVGGAGFPGGGLSGESVSDGLVIKGGEWGFQGAKAGLVLQDHAQGDVLFSCGGELGPESRDERVEGEVGVFEGVQEAGGGDAFGGGPHQDAGGGLPGF